MAKCHTAPAELERIPREKSGSQTARIVPWRRVTQERTIHLLTLQASRCHLQSTRKQRFPTEQAPADVGSSNSLQDMRSSRSSEADDADDAEDADDAPASAPPAAPRRQPSVRFAVQHRPMRSRAGWTVIVARQWTSSC